MPEETIEQLLTQLEEKVKQEVAEQHVYEALQYVQSFVARKKKILGVRGVSNAVFLGARLLVNAAVSDESAAAGASGNLLKWFIENGAGSDHPFHFHPDSVSSSNYCDTQNLLELLQGLPSQRAGPIVSLVYNPFHLLLTKRKVKKHSGLAQRVTKLENVFADSFLATKHFLQAFKCFSRLENADKLAETLKNWADEAYATERPLFFGRGLLTLLGDGKVTLARDLLHASAPLVSDNIAPGAEVGGANSSSLAVYHVAVTLTELATLPPHDRVNKPRLFIIVYKRYASLFAQLDTRLLEVLVKVGETVFNFDSTGVPGGSQPAQSSPSPMALLQQMFAGGGGGGAPQQSQQSQQAVRGRSAPQDPFAGMQGLGGAGGFDMNAIMNLLGRMQQAGR